MSRVRWVVRYMIYELGVSRYLSVSKLDWQVGRGGEVLRTDPYHGLQWETRESWQVESWEGSLDTEGR